MWAKPVVFCVVPFLVCVQANSEDYEEEKSTPDVCVVPPQPRHGMYLFTHVSEEKRMGHPNDFILNVTCDSGYKLDGANSVSCLAGHWFEQMPICIHTLSTLERIEIGKKCERMWKGILAEKGMEKWDGKGKWASGSLIHRTEHAVCKQSKPSVISCNAGDVEERSCFLENDLIGPLISKRLNEKYNPCGIEPSIRIPVIAGGRPYDGREIPWHAAIYTKKTKPYMQICGGTLVSKIAVISAAHCFWLDASQKAEPKENYAVALGKIQRPWNADEDLSQKFDVSDIKIPPRFKGSITNFQDDIAIVILSDEVSIHEKLTPVCLSFDNHFDEDQLRPGALGKTGGWGLTSEDGKSSPQLMIAQLPYIDIETCIAGVPPSFTPYITSDKICAGHTNGTAVCKGDSGGGLVFRRNRRYYLRGIVSTAPSSDHLCNVYTWATFTHIQEHERFIRQFVEFQEPAKDEFEE